MMTQNDQEAELELARCFFSPAVEWFVWDAEVPEPRTGLASVIRQEATEESALYGLI